MKNNNDINKSAIELMMGHSLIKLDENYYRPTREDLFSEYKKAIPELTIFGN